MILIVAAMKTELEGIFGLDTRKDYWEDCTISYTGIGMSNVARQAESWTRLPTLETIISVGFAGAIDPTYKSGDLCLIEQVTTRNSDRYYYPSEDVIEVITNNLNVPFTPSKLVSLEETASSVATKQELQQSLDANIIDQETYWVAKFAHNHKVPFIGIRVVHDELEWELPPAYCYDNRSGRPSFKNILFWAVKNPIKAVGLPLHGVNNLRARYVLANAVEKSISLFAGVN